MIPFNMTDMTEQRLQSLLVSNNRPALDAINRSANIPKQIKYYQAGLIFALMQQYNKEGNLIAEIGTRLGYSASIIAQAAPLAKVITYETEISRVIRAKGKLLPFKNIKVIQGISWEILKTYEGPQLAAIFVDGDHKHASLDVPWFNWLQPDGLILFHDYTVLGSIHVVTAVDKMVATFNRPPDIEVIDSNGIGMAGFYRQEGEHV